MAERFAALPDGTLSHALIGGLTAVYHRATGETHLLVDPAPQLLDALVLGPADVSTLRERLAIQFDFMGDDDADLPDIGAQDAMLGAALHELHRLGLVTALDD